MVEVRPDNTSPSQWTKTVFIDGEQLRLQCPEDPIIEGNVCIVRCLTDKAISSRLDPSTVKYQVKPFVRSVEKDGLNKGIEITTFYLQLK